MYQIIRTGTMEVNRRFFLVSILSIIVDSVYNSNHDIYCPESIINTIQILSETNFDHVSIINSKFSYVKSIAIKMPIAWRERAITNVSGIMLTIDRNPDLNYNYDFTKHKLQKWILVLEINTDSKMR